jgi:hypothetical protein
MNVVDLLNENEKRILSLLLRGLNVSQVADNLRCTADEVNNVRLQIIAKFEQSSPVENPETRNFQIYGSKRKFPRFNFVEDVEFNASGVPFSGITKNVSRDGIGFISQSFSADVGTPLQFQMHNPQVEDTIEGCGDIVWKRKMDDEWHLGLRFQFINNVDKSDILNAIMTTG